MGATVFNRARLGSIPTEHGMFYIWEENTHCIKEGPTHANWCVMAFGDRKRIIKRIYDCAASIPGGMLKTGQSATAFVDSMLMLLDTPLKIEGEKVLLENSARGFGAAITDENRAAVKHHLTESGRCDLAARIHEPSTLEKGWEYVELNLRTDAKALSEIINVVEYEGRDYNDRPIRCRGISPWKVFKGLGAFHGEPGPTEEPVVGEPHVPSVRVFRTSVNVAYGGAAMAEHLHVHMLNGKIIQAGPASDYLAEHELIVAAGEIHATTGGGVLRKLLKSHKAAMESPEVLDDETVVRIETRPQESWYTKNLNAVRTSLGLPADGAMLITTIGDLARVSRKPFNELRFLMDAVCRSQGMTIDVPCPDIAQETLL